MQKVREIAVAGNLVQQHNEGKHLEMQSVQPLPEGMGLELSELMDQLQGRYPNQELGPVTVEMYLTQWEKTALRYGLPTFRRALLKLCDESRYLPDPVDIRETCSVIRRSEVASRDAKQVQRELLEWKDQWERESREA